MLAVNRHHFPGAGCTSLANQVAGDHQRFLVGERYALTAFQSGKRRVESRGPNDCIENDVDVAPRRRRNQRIRAALPRVVCVTLRLDHPDERR